MGGSKSYFAYLVEIIDGARNPQLCQMLFDIPFHWDPKIVLDENSAENGKYLRVKYFEETGNKCDRTGRCSVLEVLVSMAIGMEQIMAVPGEEQPERWFWEMIDNLDLENGDAEDKIERWMNRDFTRNGEGGMFPIRHPHQDQRTAPFWQQAMAYLGERV